MGRVEHGSPVVSDHKLPSTPHSVGRCAHKSPISKMGKCVERVEQDSLKLKAASHNNTSWYTDTDGFLEHLPSKGSLHYKEPMLQKIILLFGDPPSHFNLIVFVL